MRTIDQIIENENEAQARVGELYTAISDEVSGDADLSGLTSTSKTSDFGLWKHVWAAMAWIQEGLFSEFIAEVNAKAKDVIPGTDYWFQKELLKFQYGDTLSVDLSTGKYSYPAIIEANKIIKRCAVVSSGGLTQVKVAKESAGVPVALSGGELSAFASYMRRIQWAGANIASPVSMASDKINAPMTIYYDGTITLAAIKAVVEAAFNSYLSILPFNGQYLISGHQDSMQAVAGVNDVVPGAIQVKPDGGAYATISRVHFPIAGYIEKDPAITFDDMLTYIPQ